jgi:hypothetical protein
MRWIPILYFSFLAMTFGLTSLPDIATAGDNALSANREALTTDLVNLANRAQQYYHRPITQGGGQGSYVGLTTSAFSKLSSKQINANGIFSISSAGTATNVSIQALGTEKGSDGNVIKMTATVFADSASLVFAN